MSEDKKREGETAGTGWRSKRRWIVSAIIPIAAIMCGLAWKVRPLDSRSIDEKLAAIDAEFAIPDSENAAVFYRRFFPSSITTAQAELNDYAQTEGREPWADDEYPEHAAALDKHRAIIQQWLGNLQIDKARFHVDPDSPLSIGEVSSVMRLGSIILGWAAANDLAEGRPDAAWDKYRCMMQMVRHKSQQPATRHKRWASISASAMYLNIGMTAMQDETTPELLRLLESLLETPLDRGDEFSQITARVERLLDARARSRMSMVERLKQLWYGPKERRRQEKRRKERRLSVEANRRATIVLIALRRHKERTGSWPDSLEQIEPKVPAEMLIDPQNNGPFAYRLAGDSFVFYSKGPNGVDEHGSYKGPADDSTMWPRKSQYDPNW